MNHDSIKVQVGGETIEIEVRDGKFVKPEILKRVAGTGSALKPAWEPVILARKPLSEANIAQNVLRWGTGGLAIDKCRIGDAIPQQPGGWHHDHTINDDGWRGGVQQDKPTQGRWPANLILDDGAAELLDAQSGPCKTGGAGFTRKNNNSPVYAGPASSQDRATVGYEDTVTGASRFFYTSKASRRDRDEGLEGMPEQAGALRENGRFHSGGRTQVDGEWVETGSEPLPKHNGHPTVKPTDLMRWLVRLVTPPNGTVLDPFAGSGSTGKAAMLEGFSFIGIEIDEEYLAIADKRIAHAIAQYVKQQELAALQPRLLSP